MTAVLPYVSKQNVRILTEIVTGHCRFSKYLYAKAIKNMPLQLNTKLNSRYCFTKIITNNALSQFQSLDHHE